MWEDLERSKPGQDGFDQKVMICDDFMKEIVSILEGRLAGWLAGRLAGWLPGWLAGWLAGCGWLCMAGELRMVENFFYEVWHLFVGGSGWVYTRPLYMFQEALHPLLLLLLTAAATLSAAPLPNGSSI